ncbi:MAG: tyrosine-protein phosphatase [Planctomycetota bacterium]|nr:MAG: tyrosine-protein phosphatase [Planctomycetota bacterium]
MRFLKRASTGWLAIFPAVISPMLMSCTAVSIPMFLGVVPYNFHVIEEGQAYRSGQPTPETLTSTIETFGIRTVVNLRGYNPDKEWYDAEAAVCEAMGVTLANHAVSKQSLPSAELLSAIINTLQTADYPILIHCQGGANRTGAISAIYRILILGHDKADAMAELSPLYLHFREYAPCMDKLVEIFETDPAWLDEYAAMVDEIVCTP